jgi:exopolyphosphatase/guanosine-5'-triphosphate,3'-diphosphate pyrophosphatase
VRHVSNFDYMMVSSQLQRPAKGLHSVVVRCKCGYPQVVCVSPILENGEPFPTVFWLTCPQYVKEISQLEAAGLIKDIANVLIEDRELFDRLMEAHKDYMKTRNALLIQTSSLDKKVQKVFERTGIGGVARLDTVKCLHMHFAHYLTGGSNPVGELVKSKMPESPGVEERCTCFCRQYDLRQFMFASIDVGTNSTRLLITRYTDEGEFERVFDAVHITRIGKGVNKTGVLMDAAIEKTINVLKGFKGDMKRFGVRKYKAVGTSALRDASNSKEFLDRARKEGIEIDIIGGSRESRLGYVGAVTAVRTRDNRNKRLAVLDIGGGSTELALGTGDKCEAVYSENIGAVRMTEAFLKSNPSLDSEMSSLRLYIDEKLSAVLEKVRLYGVDTLIGVGGTMTTAVAICEKFVEYDPDLVHGYVLNKEQVEELIDKLRRMTVDERSTLPGLHPGRADIIVAGLVILERVLAGLGMAELVVSDQGILYGLLYDGKSRFKSVRFDEINEWEIGK